MCEHIFQVECGYDYADRYIDSTHESESTALAAAESLARLGRWGHGGNLRELPNGTWRNDTEGVSIRVVKHKVMP